MKMESKYITPSVTLLCPDGTIDLAAMKSHFEFLIRGGVDGILILGSIGEFFSISMAEKKKLISCAVRAIAGRVRLIVGTTSMEKDEMIKLSRFAWNEGADACIILPPYYFPLSDKRVEHYFDTLARDLAEVPLYLYNFPDRTGYTISIDVILRLMEHHRNIIGIKDTQAGMSHTVELIRKVKGIYPEFEVYSGFDDNFAHNVLSGGDGCIAGLSNIFPEICHRWVQAFRESDLCAVSAVQHEINGLMEIYQVGTPFVPYIKEALGIRRKSPVAGSVFPLMGAGEMDRGRIETIMSRLQIVSGGFNNGRSDQ